MQTASNINSYTANKHANANTNDGDAGAPRRIVPLPLAVTARLRSTLTITSLIQAISELVQNSLDAHSRHIKIQVNFLRNSCVVEDDGCGISPDDVPLLGKRYATSKYYSHEAKSPSTFGHLGITLASLAASSTLTVLTRASTHRSTSLVRFAYSESPIPPSTNNYAPDHLRLPHSGTTIRLDALFGNLPVRLKAQQASLDEDREWEKLKRVLVGLLLARDGGMPNVGITLRDASGSRKTVIKPRLTSTDDEELGENEPHNERAIEQIQTYPELRLLQLVYTPKEIGPVSCWDRVRAGRGNVMIEGWICTTGSSSRRYQFISLNSHPLLPPPHSTNVLHATLNHSFSKSAFGTVIDPMERGTKLAQKPRKGVDRYAKCILHITCTRKEQEGDHVDYSGQVLIGGEGGTGDNSSGKGGVEGENLKKCVELLQKLVDQFLKMHGFQKQAGVQEQMGDEGTGTSDDGETDTSMNSASTQEVSRKIVSHSGPKKHHPAQGSSSSRASSVNNNRSGRTSGVTNEPSIPYLFGWSNKVKSAMRDPVEEEGRQVMGIPMQSKDTDSTSVSTIGNTPLVITIPDDSDDDDSGAVEQAIEGNEDVQRLEVEGANVDDDNYLHWRNPVTNRATQVNIRTGNARPLCDTSNHHRPGELMKKRISLCSNRPITSPGIDDRVKRLKLTVTRATTAQPSSVSPVASESSEVEDSQQDENSAPKRGAFMTSILETWKNPVFALQTEPPIQALGPTQALLALEQHSEHHRGRSAHFLPPENQNGLKEMMLQNFGMEKLSKEGLRRGRVIGQVDKKFVLVVVGTSEGLEDCGELLVAIDQHAADERWRVEKLMEELCRENVVPDSEAGEPAQPVYSASSVPVSKPLKYSITSQEYEMLSQPRYKAEFAIWGVYYNTVASYEEQDYILNISHLPRILADRRIVEPMIPIDLVRGHLWDLSERSSAGWVTAGLFKPFEGNPSSWVERMRFAPKKLVEIVNSKACRSAIMFGDFLNVKECEELVWRLAGQSDNEVGDGQHYQEGDTTARARFNAEDSENEGPSHQHGCKFPFMCAHGRPSMVPLVRMSSNTISIDLNGNYYSGSNFDGYTCNNLGLGIGFAGNGDAGAESGDGDRNAKGIMWVGRRRYARVGGESGPSGPSGSKGVGWKKEEVGMGGYRDVYRKWREREREVGKAEDEEAEEEEAEEEE